MTDVISQIEAAMARQGVSRAELARRLGYTQQAPITRLLSRAHVPGEELLQDVANALGVELTVPPVPARVYRPAAQVDRARPTSPQ